MSTEIKNTLFRFVTMRAPELVEKEKVEKTFVQHPFIDGSSFKIYHDNNLSFSKKTNLKNKAALFANSAESYKKIEDLKTHINGHSNNNFFEFATWLTANRKKFTLDELDKRLNFYGGIARANPLVELDFDRKIILWDNLIYQIVTSKSNYIREAILSVLVAELFVQERKNLGQNLEALRKLAQARIIMPKKIFLEETQTTTASRDKTNDKTKYPALPSPIEPTKSMEITLINNHLSELKNLRESTEALEKRYNKENSKSLLAYQKNYDLLVEKAYEKAEKIEKTTIDPVTKQETVIVEYKDLELPKFEFSPDISEIEFLKEYSQDAPFWWIIESCQNALGYDTFAEIIEYAKEKEQKLMQLLFDRTEKSQKYKISNGMLFPVVDTISERASSTVSLHSTVSGSKKKLIVEFNRMESGASISYADYTLRFEDGEDHHGTSKISNWVNGKLQVTLFVSETIAETGGNFRLEASLITQNAKNIFVEAAGVSNRRNLNNSNITDPIAELTFSELVQVDIAGPNVPAYVLTGGGTYTYDEKTVTDPGTSDPETPTPGTPNPANPKPETPDGETPVTEYVPTGFGIRRLGIADYRKVEQEVCCYVPGEVSHIENVMASEYKERSTRRLRRTEDTTTTSKEKESEKLTDSTSTDRFEMNSEVASVLAEDTHVGGYASMNAEYPKIKLSAGADFANNTSSEESNSQAVTHAKEITERVLDRVVQKVKEERISKVIEEFEENNKHGYDNRKNDQHVSGVYRWVDKIYKNKIVNYGKRLMYEFMIPEPASFHKMAISENKGKEEDFIERPVDPRTLEGSLNLKNHLNINESTYSHWAGIYNVEIEPCISNNISIGTEFNFHGLDKTGTSKSWSDKNNLSIPDGYRAVGAMVSVSSPAMDSSWGKYIGISVGNLRFKTSQGNGNYLLYPEGSETLNSFEKNIPVSVNFISYFSGNINVTVNLQRTDAAYQQWQIDTFNAIIKAYEAKLEEYNAKIKESKAVQLEKVRTNPLFYRQIENMVLRKNCIEYLVSHTKLGEKDLIYGTKLNEIQVKYEDVALDGYAAKVKFLEQAFEWDLMSYNFYPFYWAFKEKWLQLYNVDESDDAIFRAFLQSGMARVILTIRPGFEEAVNWYMATGQVWNGGQVPTMDDELFISIVDELRETEGEVEETWETRVPTSLTIIQAGSIGMKVTTALPCDEDCKDYKLFDSDGKPVFDKDNKQVSTNPFKIIEGLTLKGKTEEITN